MGCWNSIPKDLLKSDNPFYTINAFVQIWNRDSHGLFDYDFKSITERNVEIKGNLFIYAESCNKIAALLPSVKSDDPESKKLLSIAYKEGRYWIYHAFDLGVYDSLRLPADQPWISLKHINNPSFKSRYHPKYGYKLK